MRTWARLRLKRQLQVFIDLLLRLYICEQRTVYNELNLVALKLTVRMRPFVSHKTCYLQHHLIGCYACICMIWYDIYSFAHGTTLSMKQSSDNIVK